MLHRRSFLLLATSVAAAACGDAEGGPEPEPHPIDVELGSTDRARTFEPVADGDTLPIAFGFQGGYHIWGAFRVTGAEPRDIRMRFEIRDGDTLIGAADYVDDATEADAGVHIYGGVTVFLFDEVDPLEIDGRELRMRVEVEDRTGGIGADERSIIASAADLT